MYPSSKEAKQTGRNRRPLPCLEGCLSHFKHSQWDCSQLHSLPVFILTNRGTGHAVLRPFDSERSQNWNLSAAVTTANNKNAMLCLRRYYMLVYFSVCIFLMKCWLQINNNNKKQLPRSHLRSFCGAVTTAATWLAHYNISDLSAFFCFLQTKL